jgi:hypothetical protein
VARLKGTVTVAQAIRRGTLVVNGPVFALLVGPLAVFALLVHWRIVAREDGWMVMPLFGAGFVLAWLWWAYAVPRWRLWAYERVTDIAGLKAQAVAAGLTWPDDHVFGRTELKSRARAARERELDTTRDADEP